jgi:uncharacterized protein YggT (Ycf19 family)
MSDLEDRHFAALIVNKVDDPILSLSHAVSITISRELLRTLWSRVRSQRSNSANYSLTISLCADCLDLFRRRRLNQNAIFGHAA